MIWILRPVCNLDPDPWDPWYNRVFGFVVRADNEQEARKFANSEGGAETSEFKGHGDVWLDPNKTTCEILSSEGEKGIILKDFASS